MKIKFKEFLNEQNEWDPFGEESDENPTLNILNRLGITFIFDYELFYYPNEWPPVKAIVYEENGFHEIFFDDLIDRDNFLEEFSKTEYFKHLKTIRSRDEKNINKNSRFTHLLRFVSQ